MWVIEDEPYRELYYGGEPAPAPIASHARDSVIYIGTLAKTVAPGLRVGWVVAPAEVAQLLTPVKQAMDLNTSTIDQAAAAIYLEGVDWARRTSELRAVYAIPMRAMVHGIDQVLPPGSSFTRPSGGIFVWVQLPDGWSATRAARAGGGARHVLHARARCSSRTSRMTSRSAVDLEPHAGEHRRRACAAWRPRSRRCPRADRHDHCGDARGEQTRARYPDETGYIERDGVRVFWERYGDGDPTDPVPADVVDRPLARLEVHRFRTSRVACRVLTFDGRGNGRSDRPSAPEAYAIDEFVADALAVMDATGTERGLDRVAVDGRSAGADARRRPRGARRGPGVHRPGGAATAALAPSAGA